MKTFFDNNDYNIETDGAIKNVNGAAMFIPLASSKSIGSLSVLFPVTHISISVVFHPSKIPPTK